VALRAQEKEAREMTLWLDPPGRVACLADACRSDAAILGTRIHEKQRLLQVLREHGRGKCETARKLKAQIVDLRAQQAQWADGAARLLGGPPVGSRPNRGRAAGSAPPRMP
jgi:hypothetical protein